MTTPNNKQAQHTPGPWTIHQFKDGVTTEITAPQGTAVGYFEQVKFRDKAECEANVHLIAAAPEQHRALSNAIGCFGDDDVWWEETAEYAVTNGLSADQIRAEVLAEMRAAIAKAEGRAS